MARQSVIKLDQWETNAIISTTLNRNYSKYNSNTVLTLEHLLCAIALFKIAFQMNKRKTPIVAAHITLFVCRSPFLCIVFYFISFSDHLMQYYFNPHSPEKIWFSTQKKYVLHQFQCKVRKTCRIQWKTKQRKSVVFPIDGTIMIICEQNWRSISFLMLWKFARICHKNYAMKLRETALLRVPQILFLHENHINPAKLIFQHQQKKQA